MNYLLDALKQTKMQDLFWFSGYALYLVFSYMALHSTTVISSAGVIDYTSSTLSFIAIISARVLVFLLVALFFKQLGRVSSITAVAVTSGIAITGFLLSGMVYQFSEQLALDQMLPWLMLGGFMLGGGDALITLLWARFSALLTIRMVYFYVLLCNALSLILYFIVTLIPGSLALPIAAGFFLVSAFFVRKSIDTRPVPSWEFSRPVFKDALRRMAHPVIGTSILSFMAGLMLQISGQQELSLSSFQQTSLITSAVAVLLLLLPAFLVKKPLNMGRMYAIALPLSATGFLLLPIIWNAAGGIVNSLAQLGAMVAGIILWCMLAETSRDTKLSPFLLFALGLLITNLSQLLGTVIGFVNAETLQKGDIVLTTVALVAAYLIFMVALFLFKDKSLKGEEEFAHEESAHTEQYLSKRCALIAEQKQFTPRESEIFVLLAQGFTIPVISEKLFVSENTVKSHVKSIYQKLDVHVRSELIELVNAR